jgi:hypothetical protein
MDKDLSILSVLMPCPITACYGSVQVVQAAAATPKVVSAKELFEACLGRGFKEERRCSPESLRKLLIGGVIEEVGLEEVSADEDRSIISTMTVSCDGLEMQVFFAMSRLGATIYKVIKTDV